jgi:hypothetical protein
MFFDAHAYQLAGFTEEEVREVIDDLDYLLQNSTWPYSRERTADMIQELPSMLVDFLRSVRRDALQNAMVSRSIKRTILG